MRRDFCVFNNNLRLVESMKYCADKKRKSSYLKVIKKMRHTLSK